MQPEVKIASALVRAQKAGRFVPETNTARGVVPFFTQPFSRHTQFQIFDRSAPSRVAIRVVQPVEELKSIPSRVVFVINTIVRPLRTDKVSRLPDPASSDPVRPPGAFKRMKDLHSTTPGHVILAEYFEERPPLLLDDGMAARLMTYFQKRDVKVLEQRPNTLLV